jgi:hypothetical protein
MRPGGTAGGVPRGVQDDPHRTGHAVQDTGQVVARAATEVQQASRRIAVTEDGVRERAGDPGVVPGVQEGDPVGDHLRGVPRRRPVPRRQQRHVALPGAVEGVAGLAPQGAAVGVQGAGTDRAGQQCERGLGEGSAHPRGGTAWKTTSRSCPSAATAVTKVPCG